VVSQSHSSKPLGGGVMQSLALQNPLALNESNIFNDFAEGGAVDPSINESIRESIQCSFVSSECN